MLCFPMPVRVARIGGAPGDAELEGGMRLRRCHEVLVLGDMKLLRAGAEPGSDAAHCLRPRDPLEAEDVAVEACRLVDGSRRHHHLHVVERKAQRFPRRACSRSIDSKRALKFPSPKVVAPCRSITSKKTVGRSCAVFVKICSR